MTAATDFTGRNLLLSLKDLHSCKRAHLKRLRAQFIRSFHAVRPIYLIQAWRTLLPK